ncbi:MAG: hypothetical protein ACOC8L_10120 [Spirochaetota bacterium]
MTKLLRSSSIVVVTGLLSSCGSGGAGGGGNGFAWNPIDEVVIGSDSFVEGTSSVDPVVCEPQILADHWNDSTGAGGELINLLVSTGYNGSSFSVLELNMNLWLTSTRTGTANYGAGTTPGTFGATIDNDVSAGTACTVGAGTVDVTRVEGNGGKVEGTFSFTTVSGSG